MLTAHNGGNDSGHSCSWTSWAYQICTTQFKVINWVSFVGCQVADILPETRELSAQSRGADSSSSTVQFPYTTGKTYPLHLLVSQILFQLVEKAPKSVSISHSSFCLRLKVNQCSPLFNFFKTLAINFFLNFVACLLSVSWNTSKNF